MNKYNAMQATDPIQALFEQGMLLQQSGDLGNAQQCYERVLAAQPNHADALHLLGMVAYQSGQPGSAWPISASC